MKNWKIVLYIIAILSLLVFTTGCSTKGSSTKLSESEDTVSVNKLNHLEVKQDALAKQDLSLLPSDIRRIKESGKIVVAIFHKDRIPFFYSNEQGKLVGIDVTLAENIASSLGVGLEFDRSAKSFDEVVDLVVTGQADIAISKLSVTLSRAQRARFTTPYAVFHQSILINRLQFAALESKHAEDSLVEEVLKTPQKIGVCEATSYVEYAKRLFPRAQIVSYESIDKLLMAVESGKVLGAFYDEFEFKRALQKDSKLSIYSKLFILQDRVDPIAIAVAPQSVNLLAWLNTYLDVMKTDFAIDELIDK